VVYETSKRGKAFDGRPGTPVQQSTLGKRGEVLLAAAEPNILFRGGLERA